MNIKKWWVILLILCALGTVVLFAETTDGVQWSYSESRSVTTFTNNNSYGVSIMPLLWNNNMYPTGWLEAGQKKEIRAQVKSIRVFKIKPTNPQW